MLTEERLHEVLSKTEGVTEVIIGREGFKFLALVISPAYEGKDEGERQADAWGLLLDNLSDDEHALVSFVYTNTPEEQAQADRDAAAEAPVDVQR